MNTLRATRKAAGLTAFSLGAAAGICEMRVYHLERGRFPPHADEAERLGKALGKPVADLFPDLKRPAVRDGAR